MERRPILSCPVERERTKRRSLASRMGLRSPTEAEWEYACRAGTATAFLATLCPRMKRISGAVPGSRVNPVRLPYGPRPSGLAHPTPGAFTICTATLGNGRPTGSGYSRRLSDPKGSASGLSRVKRGGSWFLPAAYLRSASRSGSLPATVLTTWDSALLSSRSNKDSFLLQVLAIRSYRPIHGGRMRSRMCSAARDVVSPFSPH